jgi:serine/threonine protein kinase
VDLDRISAVTPQAHASGRVPKLCGAHILRTKADASAVAGFHLTLVTEYLPYSLTDLRRDAPLDEQTVRPFIADLLEALVHLHLRGVAHQDVKVANLRLKTRTGSVCLVDFGLAEHFDAPAPAELRGTPGYLAPELFFTEAVVDRRLADIYSAGIVLYNLVSSRPAFYSRCKSKVLELNRQNQLDWARVEGKLSPSALRCLQAMLRHELADTACSQARPSAEACLLEQDWFTVFLGPFVSPSVVSDPDGSSAVDESVSRRTFCSSSTCIPDGVHSSESFVGLAGKQE